MAKTYGVSIIRLAGVDHSTKPGTSLKLGGKRREAQMGSGQIAGYSETPIPAELTGAFNVLPGTDIEAIRNFDEDNIEVVTNNGHTYIMPFATMQDPPELQDQGNGVSITAIGKAAVKA
jgi:hypothetical protein